MDFDTAICLTGYGRFHYEILTVSAISIVCVGFQNSLSSYIFAAAQCELDFTFFQLSLLNVSFLIGGGVSSFLWGILADSIGRKPILILPHLLNSVITVICATNQNPVSLIICRFFNGFLIAAPGSIIFTYLAEFQPPKYRSSIICYSGLFFTSSLLFLPLIARLVLPLNIFYSWGTVFTISSWRIFLIVLVIPEIVAGLWIFLRLPESPKFLMTKGDTTKALTVLKKMYLANSRKEVKEFPVRVLRVAPNIGNSTITATKIRSQTVRTISGVSAQLCRLFKSPLLFITLITCTIMFTNMIGIFGLGLWLPELFSRFQKFQSLHPNRTATINKLALLDNVNNTCSSFLDPNVIQATITMALTSLAGNALSGWCAVRVSLKSITSFTMLLGGISAGSIYWLQSPVQNLVVASVFQAAMVIANMAIGSVVVELFPTDVCGIAICLVMCAGRLGAMASNILFGFLMEKHCEIPIFVVTANILVGTVFCWMIPNKNDQILRKSEEIKSIEVSVINSFTTEL